MDKMFSRQPALSGPYSTSSKFADWNTAHTTPLPLAPLVVPLRYVRLPFPRVLVGMPWFPRIAGYGSDRLGALTTAVVCPITCVG
jgi:hypothetical protein